MATIKSYTDINQSKKLAEILPLESADMCYIKHSSSNNPTWRFDNDMPPMILGGVPIDEITAETLPCWSLVALLGVLEHPRCFQGDKPTYWFCGCFGKDKLYHEVEADNPIDACYEMIIRLNKLL